MEMQSDMHLKLWHVENKIWAPCFHELMILCCYSLLLSEISVNFMNRLDEIYSNHHLPLASPGGRSKI